MWLIYTYSCGREFSVMGFLEIKSNMSLLFTSFNVD